MGSSDELVGAEGPRSVGTQQAETKTRNSWKSNAAVQRVSGVLPSAEVQDDAAPSFDFSNQSHTLVPRVCTSRATWFV